MKKVVILQPNYIPWKGYFDMIGMVDQFIFFDDVQYTRSDWRNRNKIKTPKGASWLTIPVGKHYDKINETIIKDPNWAKSHWSSIKQAYGKAKYFKEYKDVFENFYLNTTEKYLCNVNYELIAIINDILNIKTKILWSSDFDLIEGKTARLVDLIQQAGGTEYLSGPAAKNYIEADLFEAANIKLSWMDYSGYPEYTQLHPPFEHRVSILDLIFNEGPDAYKFLKSEETKKNTIDKKKTSMGTVAHSEIESRRFGKDIFRGNIDVFDLSVFEKFYKKNDPDILIVRLPVGEQHKLYQLNGLNKDIIHADTLVYYQVDLDKTTYEPIKNKDLVFQHADDSYKSVFENLVPKIFSNYTNHYFSNPLLDRRKITEGYTEWVINSISIPNNLHILVYTNSEPVAFITCSYHPNSAEIILNGVIPAYEGKGIYTDIVRYVKNYFNSLNIPVLRVSTQIQNFSVQKVWNKEGFILTNAYITVHLNKK